jgi:tryptophan-rich sensory protein
LLGLINIVPQLAVTVATAMAFWKLNRIAGLCLVPLAGWVAFATVLNFTIWWFNQ